MLTQYYFNSHLFKLTLKLLETVNFDTNGVTTPTTISNATQAHLSLLITAILVNLPDIIVDADHFCKLFSLPLTPDLRIQILSAIPASLSRTAFTLAVRNDDAEVVKAFVNSKHASSSELWVSPDEYGDALISATKNKKTAVLNLLLENQHCTPKFLMHSDEFGTTILMLAIQYRFTTVIKTIVENRHCTTEVLLCADKYSDTALYLAAQQNLEEVVKILVESKYCTSEVLSCADKYGTTPLIFAAIDGNTEIIKILLNSKHCTLKVLMQADKSYCTALDHATKNGHENVKRLLEDKILMLGSQVKSNKIAESQLKLVFFDCPHNSKLNSQITLDNGTTLTQ